MKYSVAKLVKRIWFKLNHRSHSHSRANNHKSSKFLDSPLPKRLSNPSVIESLEVLAIEEESLKRRQSQQSQLEDENRKENHEMKEEEENKDKIEADRSETPISQPIKESLISQEFNNKDANSLVTPGRVKKLVSDLKQQQQQMSSNMILDANRPSSTPPMKLNSSLYIQSSSPSSSYFRDSSNQPHSKSMDQFKGLVNERKDQLFKQTARYKMLMEYGISGDQLD